MPGHIKKSDGPDPDPSPWLIVSPELKDKLKSKPYDPKKSCWVPDKTSGGYLEGLIDSTDGDKVTVSILESKEVCFNTVRFANGKLIEIHFTEKSVQEGPSWAGQPSQV